MNNLLGLFVSSGFMPHGHCYFWLPHILWTHVLSDAVIAASYFAIPWAVLSFVRKRRAVLPFWWVPVLFGAFIFLCGATHIASIWTVWNPDYVPEGYLKAVTAAVSAATAIMVFRVLPQAMELKTPIEMQREIEARTQELRDANERLARALREQQESQAALKASQTQLRVVMDGVPALISYINRELRYDFTNKEYERWFGHSGAHGRSVAEVIGEPAFAKVRPSLERALAGEVVQFEQVLDYKDAGRRDVRISYLPHVVDEEVHGLVAMIEDLSDIKRAEERARSHSEWLELAQRSAGIGTFEWNLQTGENLWTRENEALYGLQPGAFTKTVAAWEERLHPEDRARMQASNRRSAATGESLDEEFRVVWPDGTVRWLQARCSVLKDSAGRPHRMVGVNVDITERKMAEHAAREADRRKDEFLATLAHELRNPLAPIRNAVQFLKIKGPTEPSLHKARDMIDRQVNVMARLVDDLLDVSRISRGRIELRHEDVDLAIPLSSAIETCRPAIESHRHTLNVQTTDEPVMVAGDVVRLSQIFSNLINNAAKYTAPGGRIDVQLSEEHGLAVVRVSDNGIGIPTEMLQSIFDMFVQVDSSYERSHGGLGIGLTLARELTHLHGGRIEARSTGPGRGSEFIVFLPLARSSSQQASPEQEPLRASGASFDIVIADDNVDAAQSLAMLLTSVGHQVRVVDDGEKAIALARELPPDIFILDIGMPHMSGYEVAQSIRALPERSFVGLIALTGWGQETDVNRALEAGFDRHITKPADLHELLSLMDEVVRSRRKFKTGTRQERGSSRG